MIDWINFGQVSAERDDLLKEYFFDTGVLKSVTASPFHFLVLGRKGAGKTAVFQRFDADYETYLQIGDCSIALSLENYDWIAHELLSNPQKAEALAFIESWKFFIYVEVVSTLEQVGLGSKYTKSLSKIIGKIYGSPAPGLSEIIGNKILKLSRLKLPSASISSDSETLASLDADGGEISFSEISNDPSLREALSTNLGNLVRLFERVLSQHFLMNKSRAFVSFDRLDEAWLSGSIDQIKPMLAGLIGACESITQKFRGSVRPIVFLREDIFDSLNLNDKNKLRSDCGKLLAWNADTLNRLILERVNYFGRQSGKAEIVDVNDLFDRDKMRQQRRPFDYLLLRSMMRPRDFISFLGLVKDDMFERKNNPFEKAEVNKDFLEVQSIYNVEQAYSDWLKEEVLDEWRTQFPDIIKLFDAIMSIGKTVFTPEEFIEAIKKQDLNSDPLSAREFLKFLYNNSVVGFKVGKSQIWRFKCFSSTQAFQDSESYKVHDGLIRGLHLKEPRSDRESSA